MPLDRRVTFWASPARTMGSCCSTRQVIDVLGERSRVRGAPRSTLRPSNRPSHRFRFGRSEARVSAVALSGALLLSREAVAQSFVTTP